MSAVGLHEMTMLVQFFLTKAKRRLRPRKAGPADMYIHRQRATSGYQSKVSPAAVALRTELYSAT